MMMTYSVLIVLDAVIKVCVCVCGKRVPLTALAYKLRIK